jgi:hypothetical protein
MEGRRREGIEEGMGGEGRKEGREGKREGREGKERPNSKYHFQTCR